jgi:hypothetical protein
MKIPPANDPVWSGIVTGHVKYDFEYFAVKLLQGALARSLCKDPSAANHCKCCETMRELFVRNSDQPLVLKDLAKITAKEMN